MVVKPVKLGSFAEWHNRFRQKGTGLWLIYRGVIQVKGKDLGEMRSCHRIFHIHTAV